MKKKALVLLLVLSLVIGTFTGITFMSASAGSNQEFVKKEAWGENLVIYKNGVPYQGAANMYVKGGYTILDGVDYNGDGTKALSIKPRDASGAAGARAWFDGMTKDITTAGTYKFSAAVYFPEAETDVDIYISLGFTAYPAAANSTKYTIKPKTWTVISVEGTLDSDKGTAPGFYTTGTAASEIFYIDDLYIGKKEKNTYATDGTPLITKGDMTFSANGPIYNNTGFYSNGALGRHMVSVDDVDGTGVAMVLTPRPSGSGNRGYFSKAGSTAAGKYLFTCYVMFPDTTDTMTLELSLITGTANTQLLPMNDTARKTFMIPGGKWVKIQYAKEFTEDTGVNIGLYTAAGASNSQTIYVDAMSFEKITSESTDKVYDVPVNVTTVGNGTVKINGKATNNADVPYGEKLFLDAEGSMFLGWYAGETLLSTSKHFVVAADETNLNANNITAKFSSLNINESETEIFKKSSTNCYLANGGGINVFADTDNYATINTTASVNFINFYDAENGYYDIPARTQGSSPSGNRALNLFYASIGALGYGKTYTATASVKASAADWCAYFSTAQATANVAQHKSQHKRSELVLLSTTEWKTVTFTFSVDSVSDNNFGLNIIKKDVNDTSINAKTGANVLVKDISIKEAVTTVELNVAKAGNGTVSGNTTVSYGAQTTLTATPTGGFKGWYVADKLVSSEPEWTVTADDANLASSNIVAKFSDIAIAKAPIGREMIVTSTEAWLSYKAGDPSKNGVYFQGYDATGTEKHFAQMSPVPYTQGMGPDGKTVYYYSLPIKDAAAIEAAGKANADLRARVAAFTKTTTEATANNAGNGFDDEGNKDKTYIISTYVKLPADSTAADVTVNFATSRDSVNVAGSPRLRSESWTLTTQWQHISWVFNPDVEQNDIFFGLATNKATAIDFLPFSIKEYGEYIPMTYNVEGDGKVDADILALGKSATISATPAAHEKFVGWYVDGKLYSTNITLNFDKVTVDNVPSNILTAKFETVNYLELVGDFEKGAYNGLTKNECTLTIVEDRLDTNNKVILASERAQAHNGVRFTVTPEMATVADTIRYEFKVRLASDVDSAFARVTVRTDYVINGETETSYAYAVAPIPNKALTATEWTEYAYNYDIDSKLPADATLKAVHLYITTVTDGTAGDTDGTNATYALEYDDFSATFIKNGELVNINTVTIEATGATDGSLGSKISITPNVPGYADGDKYIAQVLSGTEITVKAASNDAYALASITYADQKHGNNLADANGSATLKAYGTETNLTAKYVDKENNTAFVTLKYDNTTFAKVAVEDLEDALRNNLPQLYGKEVEGYVFNGTTYTVVDDVVLAVDAAGVADATVTIKYAVTQEAAAEKSTVTATGGTVATTKGASVEGGVEVFTIVTFKADAADANETPFAYWADADGNVVSTKAEYTCYVVGDIELTAVFEADYVAAAASVTVKCVETNGKFVFVADRSAADGKISEKYGIIISDREYDEIPALEVDDKGTYEDGRVIVSERTGSTPNGTYVVTKGTKAVDGSTYAAGKKIYFRAYAYVEGEIFYSVADYAELS